MVSEAEKRRVGALIRNRRQVLDLDQPALARLVGVSRQTVSKWETGQSYPGRNAGKIEAVLAPFSLDGTDGHLDFDRGDPDEAQIADWLRRGLFTLAECQEKVADLRRRKAAARRSA